MSQNGHLTHIEDAVFDGLAGAALAFSTLHDVFTHVVSPITGVQPPFQLSLKWDGSPAIVFGRSPTVGRFFVSTKAVFNKSPKIAWVLQDIPHMFSEPVASILTTVYSTLEPLVTKAGAMFQADLLYASNADLSFRKVGDRRFLTFTPNTITYGVDVDSEMANRILQSKLGLVLHTRFESMIDSPFWPDDFMARPVHFDDYSTFKFSPDVVLLDSGFTLCSPRFEKIGDIKLQNAATAFQRLNPTESALVADEPLHELLMMFTNWTVREHRPMTVASFSVFLGEREEKEVVERKSEAGQQKVRARFSDIYNTVHHHMDELQRWMNMHEALASFKVFLLNHVLQAQTGPIQSFFTDKQGLVPTKPEGFVLTLPDGRAFKLVNRAEFSRQNFLSHKP